MRTMFRLLVPFTLCTLVQGFAENAHLCDEINALDCVNSYSPGETNEIVCGSDGITYKNFCYYSQARCKSPTTHIAYVGSCSATNTSGSTTRTTSSTVSQAQTAGSSTTSAPAVATATGTTVAQGTTRDVLAQVFCASKDTVTCGLVLQPVCGSDGQFYLNRCEFSKIQCDDKTLTSKDTDFCIGTK